MKFAIGAMSAGDILDRGLKLLFARLPTFFLIQLIALSPYIFLQLGLPFFGATAAGAAAIVGLVAIVLYIILIQIGTAATLHVIIEEFIDRKVTIGQAFAFALRRFMPLLGTAILNGLIVGVGFLLCIAPGVYFYVSYIFASQVVVMENLDGMAALRRSQDLISGHRGRVFGIILLIAIAMFFIMFGIGLGLETFLPRQEFIPTAGGFRAQFNVVNYIVQILVSQFAGILFGTYLAICSTLLYLDLRIRKEGFDLELAAQRQSQAAGDEGLPSDRGYGPA
jgi:hypothetical protein